MPKEKATRFTVSLPDSLMRTLDRLRSGRGYGNRSEFVRDLLRAEPGEGGVEHHRFRTITAALHVHLDEHTCLEVIALRGTPRQIRDLANQLLAVKGVRYGQLVPATTGKRLS